MMEASDVSEMSVHVYHITRYHIPEGDQHTVTAMRTSNLTKLQEV